MKKIIKTKLLLESVGFCVIKSEMSDKSASYLTIYRNSKMNKTVSEITFNYKGTNIESIWFGKDESKGIYINL